MADFSFKTAHARISSTKRVRESEQLQLNEDTLVSTLYKNIAEVGLSAR